MLRFFTILVFSTLTINSGFSVEDDPKKIETEQTVASKPLAKSDPVEPVVKIAIDHDRDDAADPMRRMQRIATEDQAASWGHWGLLQTY